MKNSKPIPSVPLTKFLTNSLQIVKNPLPFHNENFIAQGDVFKLKIGLSNSVVFIRDAAFAEYVLKTNQKNYHKSKIQTEDLVKYVGKGLLTAEGEHWKKQRKLIQPAFHKKQLENLLESIKGAILLGYTKISTDQKIDIFPVLNDLAFQTVVTSLFSGAADQTAINRLQFITEEAQKMLVKELRQPYLGWWFDWSGEIEKHLALTREAREILKQIVKERRESSIKHHDLLDMLLDARYEDGNAMDEAQLIDEILILFTAGHETTSNALTFTAQLLALHPEWQEKILAERQVILSESSDLMGVVSQSKICQQVIEEAMRLYPPVYFIDRVNIADDSFNGFDIPTQSNLLFSVYEMHRHPELWDQPDQFMPDRFQDGSRKFSSQYFPFGAGPRKCIGNNFAMFEMILAVSELVAGFKIKPNFETIDITPLITLKPKNAFLTFENR
ncbi:cytochrome P450 [Bizionia sp. KMM 8389]